MRYGVVCTSFDGEPSLDLAELFPRDSAGVYFQGKPGNGGGGSDAPFRPSAIVFSAGVSAVGMSDTNSLNDQAGRDRNGAKGSRESVDPGVFFRSPLPTDTGIASSVNNAEGTSNLGRFAGGGFSCPWETLAARSTAAGGPDCGWGVGRRSE